MGAIPIPLTDPRELEVARLKSTVPYHLGVIPDGNRRHARSAALSVEQGYVAGTAKALDGIDWCLDVGIHHLSAFGVSRENILRRPVEEVRLLHKAVLRFCHAVQRRSDVQLQLFGEPSALPSFLPERDELVSLREQASRGDGPLVVHVGVNYSAGADLAALVQKAQAHGPDVVEASPEQFVMSSGLPPIDLVIRTGGQQRLSGFLPLQTAYAELWFTSTLWPDFTQEEFMHALAWYARQERTFGE